MKKLLKNSVFRILIIIFGNISMVVFLFGYMIPYSLSSSITIALTILLFAIFMLIFTITMYCELCFDEASKYLVVEGDLNKAYIWMQRLKKVDLFGWYKTQYSVFMSVFYRDMDQIEALELLLKDKVFQKDASSKLVYDYNSMLVAIIKEDKTAVETHYREICKTYSDKESKKKVALIYAIDMINADYDLFNKNYSGAKKNLDRISTGRLNDREKSHYYYLRYRLFHLNGNKNKALGFMVKARALYPQGHFIKEIED